MSYFNHAFRKSFLGTKPTQAASGTAKGVNTGFLITSGVHTSALGDTNAPNSLGRGTFGFFNPSTYLSVIATDAIVTSGRPLVLAGASMLGEDKIGPFHGGYKESNKSKMINPKFIHKFAKINGAAPEQAVYHIGNTNFNSNSINTVTFTGGTGYTNNTYTNVPLQGGSGAGAFATIVVAGGAVTAVTITEPGQGYLVGDVLSLPSTIPFTPGTPAAITVATVKYRTSLGGGLFAIPCKNVDFLCGETYNLQINLWGSPVLRFLNHDLYKTLAAYTGCCDKNSLSPTPVDSTLVMIDWANQIVNDLWLQNFVQPIVYTQTGVPLFQTAAQAVAAGYPAGNVWSSYQTPGHIAGTLAGIRLIGAYTEKKFGNCSFETFDGYETEVVQMEITLTDLTGSPCDFSELCTRSESAGFAGQGYGETVLRDIILDDSYLQNHFAGQDNRIREITQGFDYLNGTNTVNRNAFYTRYIIQHSVPRYNNPSGIYDNDQYALNIYVPAASSTAFETFMTAWLAGANTGITLDSSANHTAITLAAI